MNIFSNSRGKEKTIPVVLTFRNSQVFTKYQKSKFVFLYLLQACQALLEFLLK